MEFKLSWTIRNISFCPDQLSSPHFLVDGLGDVEWHVKLTNDATKEHIGCYLCACIGSDVAPVTEVMYDMCAITSTGRHKMSGRLQLPTPAEPELESGFNQFLVRGDVAESTGCDADVVTVVCTMRSDGNATTSWRREHCVAHTRIGVERTLLSWDVNWHHSDPGLAQSTVDVPSPSTDGPSTRFGAFFTEGGLQIEVTTTPQVCTPGRTSTCAVHLMDGRGQGQPVASVSRKFRDGELWKLSMVAPATEVWNSERLYLPEGTLPLQCELTHSDGLVVLSEIEERYLGMGASQDAMGDQGSATPIASLDDCGTLRTDLWSLFEEGSIADVELRTDTRTFQAHSSILAARSPVFKDMLDHSRKKRTFNVQDLDEDTVRGLLRFVYKDSVVPLQWDSAVKLYSAADLYDVAVLRTICAAFLRDNVTVSYACELLLLASMHGDDNLKRAAQDFIRKHQDDILHSDGWKALEKGNARLAIETYRLILAPPQKNDVKPSGEEEFH